MDIAKMQKVLRIALHSPYPGEKAKAISLLERWLESGKHFLYDLDTTFAKEATIETLKSRAGIALKHEVKFRSHEEALLYVRILEKHTKLEVTWLEGHHISYETSFELRDSVEADFRQCLPTLQQYLSSAQQQALQEYQQRRKELFRDAIERAAQHQVDG
ncbi:hypothetical protein Deipr_1482 [Deinococcus proteolyticus MRP]|uniref:Uncharacterized protein n=1 Tax=Deinococcus proteolyticus (strain ATCC 35074 / DSM 20540 / JCM 6276 / NBRC 101906 / NCIMB 13154 / VKM Ac-1939 / CCM 2703 / MRP) TaxID=693977 RepID=F0RJX6_DEIPM|nr:MULTISPECIES: hypothetical protein [Deinococcus]ADY26622.1 hypothetical protein Deipr_1482 [Deinococcus proteolyticus MRP]MCY1702747.1 hypothetical protein [Deinococcus sp. SL84]